MRTCFYDFQLLINVKKKDNVNLELRQRNNLFFFLYKKKNLDINQKIFFFLGKTRTRDKYRIVYTDQQRYELENEFIMSKYISIPRKSALSLTLSLSERQVSGDKY